MQERVSENDQKQSLIEQLNDFVSNAIQEILDEEKAFYEASDKDRLKVQPFTNVKRIPRTYSNENSVIGGQKQLEIPGQEEYEYDDEEEYDEEEELRTDQE